MGTTSSGISDNLGDIYSKFVHFRKFGHTCSLRFWNINASILILNPIHTKTGSIELLHEQSALYNCQNTF
jgi:hypothetical protein